MIRYYLSHQSNSRQNLHVRDTPKVGGYGYRFFEVAEGLVSYITVTTGVYEACIAHASFISINQLSSGSSRKVRNSV